MTAKRALQDWPNLITRAVQDTGSNRINEINAFRNVGVNNRGKKMTMATKD